MGISFDPSPFFAIAPTVSMTIGKDTAGERIVTVLDGKLTINPGGGMSGIVNDFGYTPGRSKTVKMKATDGAAPDVKSVVHINSEAWRVMSVQSDAFGVLHSIDIGDEFAG